MTTVEETVRYYPDFRLKWGEYLCESRQRLDSGGL